MQIDKDEVRMWDTLSFVPVQIPESFLFQVFVEITHFYRDIQWRDILAF